MTIRQIGIVLRPLVMLVLSLSFGCAQQMKSVQAEPVSEVSATAQIQSITVADDTSRVEIISDNPIIYTYYMLESPPRVIVDIAQTAPGNQAMPIMVNRGGVKQINASKHEFGSGVLSRIDISLDSKAEISAALDKQDKKKLILSIPPQVKAEAAAPEPAKAAPAPAVETVQIVEPKPVTAENQEQVKTESKEPVASSQVTAEPAKNAPSEPVLLAGTSSNLLKAGERALTAIKKSDNGLILELSAEPDSFKTFKLNQPDRLVIDIPKTRSAISSKVVDVNAFNLGKARVGTSPDKLRVVFDATGVIPQYVVTKNSSGLLIAFEERAKKQTTEKQASVQVEAAPVTEPVAAAPVPAPQPSTQSKPAVNKTVQGVVEAIEFTQADDVSRITIRTSGNCIAGEPVKTAKGLSLSLKSCRLPVKLQRQLDTRGFDSAIKSIAPFSVKGGAAPAARVAVNLRNPVPNTLNKEADLIQWDFKEPVKVSKQARAAKAAAAAPKLVSGDVLDKDISDPKVEPAKSKSDKAMEEAFSLDKAATQPALKQGKTYTGRKVTLEFSDADIKKIFQLLAEVSNQNILVSDDVTGTISLKLVNVPWDQALDVILENKGLGMQKEGNIVQIRPRTKMKSLDDEAVEMRLTEEKKMPLSTVIFDVNFAELTAIKTQFDQLKSKRTDSSISTDLRTNKIIVVDIDPNISKMRKLLDQLDIPEKQVMIEARIVEASSNFARDIGVKWNFGYQDGSASVANINNLTGSMGGVVTNVLPTGTTGGVAAGMSFGKLLSNIQLDMRLSAASTVGQVKIISTPKVLTVNNKPAKISQGQMIPYQNTSSSDGAKTEFIEAALSLEVTPHITADGSVNMKIKASNNTAGVGSPPPINKKEATTELVVRNGETTVIGGIYVDSETEGDTGVPYISDIPLLGWLFKSNAKSKTKNEMLIFITPKIMN
jgi:type IV pilus assembly protein PilQ